MSKTTTPTPRPLSNPAVMLDTLKLAYRFALDHNGTDICGHSTRLTEKQEKELSRRLARYWLMDESAFPQSQAASMLVPLNAE